MKHIELYQKLSEAYPPALSAEWDHDGIMVMKDGEQPVCRVLVALDLTADCAKKALLGGFDLILTHHPLLFRPLDALYPKDPLSARALMLYEKGISVFSFHTRLDCAEGGVNDTLATLLGLSEVTSFEVEGLPMGRIGRLPEAKKGSELAEQIKEQLGCPQLTLSLPQKRIERLALLGGSGGGEWKDALLAGADGYLTGEASHHHLLDAGENALCLFAAGHDYTERPVCHTLKAAVEALLPEVRVEIYDQIAISRL